MREQPEQPCEVTRKPQCAEVRRRQVDDRGLAADRREVAVVDIAKRQRRLALEAPQQVRGGSAAHLLGGRAHAGHGGRLGTRRVGWVAHRRGEVADDRDLGVIGQAQVGSHDDAPGPVERGAGARGKRLTERRASHACRPDHRLAGQAVVLGGVARAGFVIDAVGVDAGHLAARAHVDTELLQLLARTLGELRHEVAEHAVGAFDQHDAGARGVDAAKLLRQGVLRDLGHGARHLDAGRPGADHDESHPRLARRRIVEPLGAFERADDACADAKRVVERLQARRVYRPIVMAEVAVRCTCGDDQVVVRQRLLTVEPHLPGRRVDADHLGLQDCQVAALHLGAQRVADRRADGRRAQARGRHLVQQRLEQVVVGAVDQRDLDLRFRERAHRLDAAESAAHDHDLRFACHHAASIAAAGIRRRLPTIWMWLRSEYSSSA